MCEQSLWAAVIVRAVEDACTACAPVARTSSSSTSTSERDNARDWLLSPAAAPVAAAAGIEPSCLQAWAATLAATGWKRPAALRASLPPSPPLSDAA